MADKPKIPLQPQHEEEKKKSYGPLIFILIIIGVLLFFIISGSSSKYKKINTGLFFSWFPSAEEIARSKNSDGSLISFEKAKQQCPVVELLRVGNEEFRGKLNQPTKFPDYEETIEYFRVELASDKSLPENFDNRISAYLGEKYNQKQSDTMFSMIILYYILPIILIFGLLWFLFFRRSGGGASGAGAAFSFAKSKARIYKKGQVKITFKDVAGIDEAVEETSEIVQFLKTPEKFVSIGGQIPRGVLLVGPPGCGKTLLAKAIAGEADVSFFSISGSDFVEMFVGVGASRVRDLFKQAREKAPCVVFLDEIDAVGRHRGSGLGGGHDEREQTLNQILVEMDGFEPNSGIIILAATNRPDVLDPALLRPGRFDRQVVIDLPDVKGRALIFGVHLKKVKHSKLVDNDRLARATPGFTGADIANMVNEAAIYSVMHNKQEVDMEALEESRDKVRFGKERRSRVVSEKEHKLTAYHEGGHALVQHLLPNTDPVHKVTITPRGQYGGATMSLPLEDRQTYSESYLRDMLVVMFSGRVAERIVFDDVTTGASSDIKNATEIARQMITNWGMNQKIGPMNVSDSEEHIFLGREISRQKRHSEETSNIIDEEMRKLIHEAEDRAFKLITENREKLDLIAQALLQFETISGEELKEIIETGKIEVISEMRARAEKAKQASAKEAEKAEKNKNKTQETPEFAEVSKDDSKNDSGDKTLEDADSVKSDVSQPSNLLTRPKILDENKQNEKQAEDNKPKE